MSYTQDRHVEYLKGRIEWLKLRLDGWKDKSMPAFQRTITEKIRMEEELGRLLARRNESENAQIQAPIASAGEFRSTKKVSKLGENIRRYRKELGWSQTDLAKRSGIDKKQIVAHEKGRGAYPRTLLTYAETFTKGFREKNNAATAVTVQQLEK